MAGWGMTTFPISRLAQQLNDALFYEDEDQGDIKEDALFLAEACPLIDAVLGDAEEREIRDKSVKSWLCSLKDLGAEAEDLLEEYEYDYEYEYEYHLQLKTVNREVHGYDEMEDVDKKKKKYVHAILLNKFSNRIRRIRKKFDDIYVMREKLRLKADDGNRRRETPLKRQVGHLANEPIMYGRCDEEKQLVNLLKNNKLLDGVMPNHKNEYVGVVISLVGVGGIGKTTLAQAIYKDKEINNYFDCKAWVTVSESFDVVQITKDILASLMKQDSKLTQISVIQERLEERLQRKKFLLVLDDIWKEELHSLGFLLQMGSIGSKILITTRTRLVAKALRPSIAFELKPLSEQDGWKLFHRHAFGGENEDHVAPYLVRIGKEIAERCKGFPLLLKVLGDNLREVSVDKKRWGEILKRKILEIKNDSGNNDVMEILMFSYNHLPKILRQCFLHCSVFPRGYKFRTDELTRIWAAHGLIKVPRQVEDIGEEYVNGLSQRSFIQPYGYEFSWYTRRKGVTFSLHDVMHDLARYILKSEQSLTKNHGNTLKLHRPLMVATSQNLRCYYEPVAGRTFIQSWYPSKQVVINDMLTQHLKRLRVLILEDHFLKALPISIGDLKHLRYLCLRTRWLRRLPDSVCLLHNLQTLECRYLQELPQDIRRLKRLQHLLVNLAKLPPGIGELVELQTLKTFRASTRGDNKCARLLELKDLSQLGGEFKISGLNNVDGAEEAKLLSLSDKPNLQHLVLEWDPVEEDDSCQQNMALDVLDNLKPHKDLEELDIFFYAGTRFPKWLGTPLSSNLTTVNLYYCSRCITLPALGELPCLTRLYIKGIDCLECIDCEFYGTSPEGAFKSLQYLNVSHADSLKEWWGMDQCPFPQLSSLYLAYCPSLRFKQVDLARMFDTVRHMFVSTCPYVEEWCKAHVDTTLAKVKDLTVDSKKFYVKRRGDKTFFLI